MVGKSLGHYEVLELLGRGAMGEVYRALDTNLHRDVAIKVLPEDLAGDSDRLARLRREAHLLAAVKCPPSRLTGNGSPTPPGRLPPQTSSRCPSQAAIVFS